MFQPAIPFEGLAGWRFLQRTYDTQISAFSQSTAVKRDTDYFRENITEVKTAEDLVSDRRLLTVALGAFGLQDDINNRYFIQKMLEEGTSNADSFANKFSDSRYREFSAAFGFGPGELKLNTIDGFADRMIDDFERQGFEVAVGAQSNSMRVAMTADREFADLAASQSSETSKWFSVMGNPPLRQLFETALQLPESFSQVDIDTQQRVFANRSKEVFGTSDPGAFSDPELQEKLLGRYTALSQLSAFSAQSGAATALTLLRGG